MAVLAGFVVGLLAARLLWLLLRGVFAAPALGRANHRGVSVPVGAGLVLPLAVLVIEGARAVAAAFGVGSAGITAGRGAVLIAVTGFGLLGLFDDLVGEGHIKGFRGHLRALAGGRLTTGGMKLLGGVAVGLAAAGTGRAAEGAQLLVDGALIALAANLANLFDRAPGRTTKVGLVCFAGLVAAAVAAPVLAPVAVVAGAAAGLLLDDLHERLMLGDTGANALGGALALGAVLALAASTRLALAAALLALNLLSEVVSFSRVIDAIPPLRVLDRAGRRPSAGPGRGLG